MKKRGRGIWLATSRTRTDALALNHPFVDGNKRVAAHAAILFALVNGFECLATPDELVAVTPDVAKGQVQVEALGIWFRQRLRAE